MNIKDAIDKGFYPKDEKGRALVPMTNGDTATILATDLPDDEPICGWDGDSVERWCADGAYGEAAGGSILRLLPPPPRKVEVVGGAVVGKDGRVLHFQADGATAAKLAAEWSKSAHYKDFLPLRGVELTGSYEEPWS